MTADEFIQTPTLPQTAGKIRGRGANINPTGRFESVEVVYDPDPVDGSDDETPAPRTRFFKDSSKTVITFNDSPDVGFSASVNPYRGCEHGCVYCYARPTHEYLGLSCGLDFETRIFVKADAPKLLRESLSKKSWQPQVIALCGVTDPYQPVERQLKLTRQCLEVLLEFRNPVCIVTKNHLVTRDLDILAALAEYRAAGVFVSVTTLDEQLARVMEPRTSAPSRRINAIEALHQAGVPVGVLMGPIIPGLTDHEIDAVLQRAAQAGARTAAYTMLRLPYGVKDLFQAWLETHFPTRKNKILNRIREVREGALNDASFTHRLVGKGQYAGYVAQMFALCKKRHGLDRPLSEWSVASFRSDPCQQLRLW